jgi:sugar phosphate isomerase/epimerase
MADSATGRPQLSLDCLTLTDTRPAELIRAAGAAGFHCVSLWLQPPSVYPAMQVTAGNARECEQALADTGVRVHSLEAFDAASKEAIESYRPALELGARLGGKAALAYHLTVEDRGEAADLLARFAETAAEYGLATTIEPILFARTSTLAQARDLIRASGADVRILFDTWHLIRGGGDVKQLRAIEPELIGYVQLNDGLLAPPENPIVEVTGERRYLGTGEFPLVELLSLVRRDVPWGNETPSLRRAEAGVDAAGQAREVMAAMQGLLAQVGC